MTQTVSRELEDWFQLNVSRGCRPEQLHQSLIEAGYPADFVSSFLSERSRGLPGIDALGPGTDSDATMLSVASPSAEAALDAWWTRFAELSQLNHVNLGDRTAVIAGRQLAHGILYLRDLLSADECDTLVADAERRIEGSTVVDPETGRFVPDPRRSSMGTYFERAANPVVAAVEQRLAVLSGLPEVNGEGLQILFYQVGGEYRPHFDYFDPANPGYAAQLGHGGQRLLTIILYLNDVEGGGGTIFPELGLEFLPAKGAALMFASLDREGALQPKSLHGGNPVTAGQKWIATRWIRLGAYC